MRNIFIRAHEMTREIKAQYPEVDYRAQFGLNLSYLLNKEEEEEMITIEGIKDEYFIALDTKIELGKTVTIEYTKEHETDKAILIKQIETKHRKRGTRQLKIDVWLPKSQIVIYEEQELIAVPRWLVEKNYLHAWRAVCDLDEYQLREQAGLEFVELTSTDRINLIDKGLAHWEK